MKIAVLVMVLSACAPFCPKWRDRIAVVDASLLACDTAQTIRFSDFGQWDLGEHGVAIREANPILGERPSPTTLIAWLGVNLVGVIVADRMHSRWTDAMLALPWNEDLRRRFAKPSRKPLGDYNLEPLTETPELVGTHA